MEHPLGLLVQRVAAALCQLIRQLNEQVLRTALLHVCGHGAQQDGAAAKIGDLQPRAFQQVEIGQQGCFFLGRKLHHHGLQQQLAGHIAVIRRQLFKQLALVGGVLIDDADLLAALG